ncbi:phosphonate C-P lyase system protein PhnG [Bacillus canaveralius]|uniref:phosphonate C-P lyase system protein PhnG n=1 Tax=Bacillus canaveralius TaxID=1403243 RepID=UPI0016395D45|nr:phosphonate C-P lyase system protein PhnG [Bacillus canaveralius]
MKKARLSKILIEGNPETLAHFAKQVEETVTVRIERSPATGLVMMKTRDSVSRQPFYMGEILVTECTVEIDGHYGLGVIMGEEPVRAYQLALVDAAFNANLMITEGWIAKLEEEERIIQRNLEKQMAMVSRTQVNFETMEDYNDKG